ncbi:MAG: hypothetical protein IPJ85_09460 [Flavobacteriales bacterium]|nr:hypothetical protein [Flavobacteriales bacterium]
MARAHALIPVLAVLLAACGTAEERAAERALRTGASFYNDSSYMQADSAFATAPHDARAIYDRGMALLALDDHRSAVAQFSSAAEADTLLLRPIARYNQGNALLREARYNALTSVSLREEAFSLKPGSDDIADRLRHAVRTDSMLRASNRLDARIDTVLPEAIKAYKAALLLAPDDDDARHNLLLAQGEWAKRQKERSNSGKNDNQQKDLSAQAKLLMEKADALVEEYRFQEALALLQDGLRKEPSLSSKKEYMEKLDLVTKAAASR